MKTHPFLKTHNKHLAWVLAAVNEMIEESIYYCDTFAHTLQAHHNETAAAIFSALSPYFKSEQEIVLAKLPEQNLPAIPPWEIPHQDYEHPANALMQAHYLMTEHEAWQIVTDMIQVHHCFYRDLIANSSQKEVIDLITSLQTHCLKCEKICATKRVPTKSDDPQDPIDDLDAPVAQS
ncbi:hypothetical protein CYQ88_02495 [Hydrogenovibrio sp. SC-1]|uniref:hypothetical protein n=1 Tax=Hydrogenovibrio sp. SC-1 TaxID=2065820 RepID=UPI000C7C5085|nr:hypothetical protein [Hydrogenovibrio sp. SC-1]PLA75114.1 hypothetical protein CYQ88_02495 [Hydrogenovibrio sp. SC-1]